MTDNQAKPALEILLDVLQKVQADMTAFRAEMTEFRVESGSLRTEVKGLRSELNGFRVQMNDRLESLENGARQETEFVSNMLSRIMVAIQKLSPEQENSDRLSKLEREFDGLRSRIAVLEV